jgi:hypothetical protein
VHNTFRSTLLLHNLSLPTGFAVKRVISKFKLGDLRQTATYPKADFAGATKKSSAP